MTPSRRSFLTGLAATFAAPAIVRASSLMPVRGIVMPLHFQGIPLYFDPPPRAVYWEAQRRWWWVDGAQTIRFSKIMSPVEASFFEQSREPIV